MPDWYGFSLGTSLYKGQEWSYYTYQGWKNATTYASQWKFRVHRLHFYFKSNYTLIPRATLWAQLNDCLRAISESGAKAVLDLHNYYDSANETIDVRNVLCGSQDWFNEWLALVDHFKNDPRVVAWELYNESFYNYLDPAYGGDGTNVATDAKAEGLMKAQYDLSVQIRAVEPTRPIIWFPYYRTYTPIDSPVTHTNYTQLIQNIILTEHPYSYGARTTAEEMLADWNYRLIKINRDAQAYPLWFGEIECHGAGTSETLPMEQRIALEEEYVTRVLNYAYLNRIGFAIWKYPYMDMSGSDADRIIAQSGYEPTNKYGFAHWQDNDINPIKRVIL